MLGRRVGAAAVEGVAVKLGVMAAILTTLMAAPVWAAGQLIVVVGAAGEADYGRQFAEWADRWAAAGDRAMKVEQIGRDDANGADDPTTRPVAATSPTKSPATRPASDKDALQAALRTAAASTDGPVWLVLIGHGTADERGAKFNLRGPDLSDAELAEWLRPVKRPIAVIDCSSASGPFLRRLSAPGRVVIVATRGGGEYQFARFGDAISGAVIDPAADLDKDGRTSLLEAFLIATHRVNAFYTSAGRLVTEHAMLDDTGDGTGVSADAYRGVRLVKPPAKGNADGVVANQWFLHPVGPSETLSPDADDRRAKLESEVDSLRGRKAALPVDEYYERLERLMIELAKLHA